MELKNPMLVVTDMARSLAFYQKVFDLRVILDFGANKTLTGGLVLQTAQSFREMIRIDDLTFGGNNFELYFEEDDFDGFLSQLEKIELEYVHPVKEHPWGQRVVRIYDPDRHIIEVGENIRMVVRRFLDSGMTPEQTAQRMDVPLDFVRDCMDIEKGESL